MAVQFTSCPACGAVGEIGNACQFCGTTIVQKERVIITNSRIVNVRTVTPQEYANKLAIYHQIESYEKYSIVSIGDQNGVINLNGDLVYPLGKHDIGHVGNMVVRITLDARVYLDNRRYLNRIKYVNLETLEESFDKSFVKDKSNPQHLHRLLEPKTWKIENTYTNIKGETHKYDYATCLETYTESGIYLFHKDNGGTLWIKMFLGNCILENVKSADKPIWKENKNILPIELMDGRKVEITLCKKFIDSNGKEDWKHYGSDDIYEEWSRKTGFDLPIKRKEEVCTQDVETSKSILDVTITTLDKILDVPSAILNKIGTLFANLIWKFICIFARVLVILIWGGAIWLLIWIIRAMI